MRPSEPQGRGLLDTSTLLVLPRLDDAARLPTEPVISAVTLAELSVGPLVATTEEERSARQAHLQQAEADFDPLPFDAAAARAFGRVATSLRRAGRKTSARAYDAIIAAVAIAMLASLGIIAGTLPLLGRMKHRLGATLGSPATAGEGTQNILCAYLSLAIPVGLGANALFGLWWADPAVALIVALVAIQAGLQTWRGQRLLRRLLNRHRKAVTERGACPRLVGTTSLLVLRTDNIARVRRRRWQARVREPHWRSRPARD